MYNNTLKHYGVLGMRWGVHRSPEVLSAKRQRKTDEKAASDAHKKYINTINPTRKKKAYADYEKKLSEANASREKEKTIYKEKIREAKDARKNPAKNMSDAELRARLNRLQMERQYRELTTSRNLSKGRKFVTEILTNATKQTATNYVSKYMSKGIDKTISRVTKK